MRIGVIGLGKLGLPVAVAIAKRGHDVIGYDPSTSRMNKDPKPEHETGPDGVEPFYPYLAQSSIRFGSLEDVVNHADILFVAVQTPHDERFDGSKVVEDSPVDFDYSYLTRAVSDIAKIASIRGEDIPIAVISTVLPGTMRREIEPLLGNRLKLVYNPFFIAMGTVMRDFLNPEFVLLGVDNSKAAETVVNFYKELLPRSSIRKMSIASAEATKVLYNTYISTKIALANTAMEVCHNVKGANVDDVTSALQSATDRIASGQYMTAGMGDGGGCHPRDNIALMWFARSHGLSFDPFTAAMRGRELQSGWLADHVVDAVNRIQAQRVVIAGYAFKPGTNITTGSPALLLRQQLRAKLSIDIDLWDPFVSDKDKHLSSRSPIVVVLGCRHHVFHGYTGDALAVGSVVIDPHRISGDSGRVEIIKLGIGK